MAQDLISIYNLQMTDSSTVVYELKDVQSIKEGTHRTDGLDSANRLEIYAPCSQIEDSHIPHFLDILNKLSTSAKEIYINLEDNSSVSSESLIKIFECIPKFTGLTVLDLYLSGIDCLGSTEYQTAIKVLGKMNLSQLSRFTFSTIRAQIVPQDLKDLLDALKPAVQLTDIHICLMRSPKLDDSIFPHLIEFLERTKTNLTKFEVSFFFCEGLTVEKRQEFKTLLWEKCPHLKSIRFNMDRKTNQA